MPRTVPSQPGFTSRTQPNALEYREVKTDAPRRGRRQRQVLFASDGYPVFLLYAW